jgi:DNA/RNA-binding protein KIN17
MDGGLKAISKRIKAKGLGRLRWYCQMCEKQCRDENGFKCHTNTPAHHNQLALFAAQPSLFIDRFSNVFLDSFMAILHQRYGSNPVTANIVYQDYIKDKDHIHMNSTKWTTLTDFVKDLGRRKLCHVEDRDGSWWLIYIDREVIERKERAETLDRVRLAEEERAEQLLIRQMRDRDSAVDGEQKQQVTLVPVGDAGPIDITLKGLTERLGQRAGRAFSSAATTEVKSPFESLASSRREGTNSSMEHGNRRVKHGGDRKPSVLDEIMAENEERKRLAMANGKALNVPSNPAIAESGTAAVNLIASEKVSREHPHHPAPNVNHCDDGHKVGVAAGLDEAWLRVGIVVKVISAALKGGPYYKKKGVVTEICEQYSAVIRLGESGAVLQLDQDDLETVLPKPGGTIVFVRGTERGKRGTVVGIDEESFSLAVRLDGTPQIVDRVEYEDVCKLSSE